MTAPPDDDDEGTIVRPPARRPVPAPPGAGPDDSAEAAADTRPRETLALGHMLPVGTRVRDYEITGLVGEGGFGIVYLAWDHSLQRRVAVKEYMPGSLVSRVAGSSTIVVKSERHLDTFRAGLKSFVNEARLLARFDHPSLVKVYRFWEENGTAYMVMPYYEGPTLKAALAELGRPPTEAELRAWLRPILDALAVMHAARCYHRDIAPDNILLTPGGPLLLDFGAARRVIGDMTHALTVVLKPGYAPIEQYGDVATMAQGAWTDLYALACVLYYAITGRTPMSSVERLMGDALRPLADVAAGRYSPAFLRAIDTALSVKPQDRPQNEAEFRALLDADLPPGQPGMGPSPFRSSGWAPDSQQPPAQAEWPTQGYSTMPATLTPELPTLAYAPPEAIGAASADEGPAPAAGEAPPGSVAAAAPPRSRAGRAIVVGGALLLALGGALIHLNPQGSAAPSAAPATGSAPARSEPAVVAAPPPVIAAPPEVIAAPAAVMAAPPPDIAPQAPTPPAATTSPAPSDPPAATATGPAVTRPAIATTQPVTPRVPREPREPPPRREPPAARSPGLNAPYAPYPSAAGSRCSDILQKASLEPLTPEEAAYLKRECR